MLTGIAVMTLVVQIILGTIEVSTCLVLFGLTVAADWATTVVEILALLFKQAQLAADLIEIFYIDIKAHDEVGSMTEPKYILSVLQSQCYFTENSIIPMSLVSMNPPSIPAPTNM